MSKRKICVVVTARPSYSRVRTALHHISQREDLELQLVIAGSALLERYGSVIQYIEKDGFRIDAKVFSVLEGENLTSMAKTAGLGLLELASVFYELRPDMVVSIADRFETISTAIAASYMNIPLAHIQGGEVTGNIDEKVRHAVTKLSDVHLVASEKARERVIKMGEEPHTVYLTGCPSIDLAEEVLVRPELNFDPYKVYGGVGAAFDYRNGYLVVMQHPVTTEYTEAKSHAEETLEAIKELNHPTFWFWPNVDAGSDGTSKAIRSFRERNKELPIHFFKNMESTDFLRFIKNSKVLIGNSSVGIREAGFLGIPVVNIGSRQNGRERGPNVLDVGYSKDEIVKGIRTQLDLGKPYSSSHTYGDGKAGERIAQILADVPLTIAKRLTY